MKININVWNLLGAKDAQDALKQTLGTNDWEKALKQSTGIEIKHDNSKAKGKETKK